jgi:L-amino acid N-acyltransferase YncA
MVIRGVQEKDLPGIREIYSLYYTDGGDLEHFIGRVQEAIDQTALAREWDLQYFIAERDGQIVGFIGFRKPPQKLLSFVQTDKPVEVYSFFAKTPRSGAGRPLVEYMERYAKNKGYKEIVVYSSDAWHASWPFYDKMGFDRIGRLTHSSGAAGQVWRKNLE